MTKLIPTEARALLALVKYVYMTCANLGDELWSTKKIAGNCSCPYARPAGAIVKRLRARGLVERHRVDGDHRTFYRATRAGEKLILTDKATRIAAGLAPR